MCQRNPYTPPGRRAGSGADSVLRYLLEDMRRKPAPAPLEAELSRRGVRDYEDCPDCETLAEPSRQ